MLVPVPFLGAAMFGALSFLILAVGKGDRGLLLSLPLLVSIVVLGLIGFRVWGILGGWMPTPTE